jgi:branched-chain amino acid transport system substrate-binding protein
MALETHNEQGGVLGRQIAWHLYDTPCQFEPAGRAAQQALDDGLEFIIGPLCSEGAIAAAVVAQERGALMIAPAAAHPLVTVDDQGQTRPTIFTVAIDNDNHPTRQAWAEQYKSLYAVEPEMLAHLGYNAATILIAAIEQTGSFDPLDVAQALEQGTFESLGGPVTFSPEHTPAYLP